MLDGAPTWLEILLSAPPCHVATRRAGEAVAVPAASLAAAGGLLGAASQAFLEGLKAGDVQQSPCAGVQITEIGSSCYCCGTNCSVRRADFQAAAAGRSAACVLLTLLI